MTTYNTQNPRGSADPRDLYDNAENLDLAVNDRANNQWQDRFGVMRWTYSGMERAFDFAQVKREDDFQDAQELRSNEFNQDQEQRELRFNQFLASSGYQSIGDYEPGMVVTEYNHIFRYEGSFFRVKPSVDLPFTATSWEDDSQFFVGLDDATLRQELNSPNGGDIVNVTTTTGTQTVAGALEDRAIGVVSPLQAGDFNIDRLVNDAPVLASNSGEAYNYTLVLGDYTDQIANDPFGYVFLSAGHDDIFVLKRSLGGALRLSWANELNEDSSNQLQSLFVIAQSLALDAIIDVDVKSAQTHQIDSDLNIFFEKGSIEFTGDHDRFIHGTSSCNKLTITNPNMSSSLPFEDRTKYHRGIVLDGGGELGVYSPVRLEGFGTNIHALNCKSFFGLNLRSKNNYGTLAQYGYGFNSSAELTIILGLEYDNTEAPEHGRHALYINGKCRKFYVSSVDVKHCVHNPINIALNDDLGIGSGTIESISFRNVNKTPLTVTAGCINVSTNGTPPEDYPVSIRDLMIDGYTGGVVTFPTSGFSGSTAENVRLFNYIEDGTGDNYPQFLARSAFDIWFKSILHKTNLPSNGFLFSFRDTDGGGFERARTTSGAGLAAIRLDGTAHTAISDFTKPSQLNTYSLANDPTYNRVFTSRRIDITAGGDVDVYDASIVRKRSGNLVVTDFTNGEDNQTILINNISDSLTISNSATIETRLGVDLVIGPRKTATFMKTGSRWVQIAP